MIRRLFLSIVLVTLATLSLRAVTLPDETLHYKVMFKWGLIQKQAGRATLQLRNLNNGYYRASLFARSEPWADRIYSLRDTLISTMNIQDLSPKHYERIAHEDGKFAHDIVEFSRQRNTFSATCRRIRLGNKKDSQVKETTIKLEAEGMTVDMLSVFYYLRSLDFSKMTPGQKQTVNIFSAKERELVTITFVGREDVKLDKNEYPAYHINFTFTSDGKKNTSHPIDTWISTDPRHIPLKLEGALKVGKIRILFTGNL